MKAINTLALILVIVGGINWGLVGAANFNLVETLFGTGTALTRIVYVLVGVAALYSLTFLKWVGFCCGRKVTTTDGVGTVN